MADYAAENGPSNFMMRNQRDGSFRDVTREAGVGKNNTRFSFCCGWADFDGDGWPDLYVVNDFGRKNLIGTIGAGTFGDGAKERAGGEVGAGRGPSGLDFSREDRQSLYWRTMCEPRGLGVST